MAEAILVVKDAFIQLSKSNVVMPHRTKILMAGHVGNISIMPAYLLDSSAFGVKIVSTFPNNIDKGKPTIFGVMIAIDAETGCPLAIMDGTYLTALRTGAASGVATELLARQDAEIVAIFGAGAQARTQLIAMCEVREIKKAWVYDISRKRAKAYVKDLGGLACIPCDLQVAFVSY